MNDTLHKLFTHIHDVRAMTTSTSPIHIHPRKATVPSPSQISAPARLPGSSFFTGRLLGRAELSNLPKKDLIRVSSTDIRRQEREARYPATLDLQAEPGPARTSGKRCGSIHPTWREAYTLVVV